VQSSRAVLSADGEITCNDTLLTQSCNVLPCDGAPPAPHAPPVGVNFATGSTVSGGGRTYSLPGGITLNVSACANGAPIFD
jgi:hypothetical protein